MTIELKYVVLSLAVTLLVCVLGIILLAVNGQPIPEVLQNIAVGALTAEAGVLVPSTTVSGRRRAE